MELPETSDKKLDVVIRCIHPNLNWEPQEGPDYGTGYIEMTTLIEDFRVKIKSKILCRSQFFKTLIEKDFLIMTKGKPIEVKITAKKNQMNVESLLICLDYLDHLSFLEIEINPKNMLSLLVTSSFLKISSLENYCVDYVSSNIHATNLIDITNVAYQIKNLKLLDKTYM
jgi:hypothetical protein